MVQTENSTTIAMVATCTKRKCAEPVDDLRYHTLGRGDIASRSEEWCRRLQVAGVKFAVDETYRGQGWSRVLAARAAANELLGHTDLYIISAGCGLLKADDTIPVYSATFASDDDQIHRQLEGFTGPTQANKCWWQAINNKSSVAGIHAKSIVASDYVVVAVSADYLLAIEDDLSSWSDQLGPGRLFVISVGYAHIRLPEKLRSCVLPVHTVVEEFLRGPRSTLNHRVLEWLITDLLPEIGWDRSKLETAIENRLIDCRKIVLMRPVLKKSRLTDAEVLLWIRKRLADGEVAAKAKLLGQLRKQYCCEQSRFYGLVDSVLKESEKIG